jgi:hypothetical protein
MAYSLMSNHLRCAVLVCRPSQRLQLHESRTGHRRIDRLHESRWQTRNRVCAERHLAKRVQLRLLFPRLYMSSTQRIALLFGARLCKCLKGQFEGISFFINFWANARWKRFFSVFCSRSTRFPHPTQRCDVLLGRWAVSLSFWTTL